MGNMTEQRAGFKSMKESTKADWEIISSRHRPFAAEPIPVGIDVRGQHEARAFVDDRLEAVKFGDQ